MKEGDKVKVLDEFGNIKYTGFYLGSGHPAESIGVKDRSKIHHAVQIAESSNVVYLETAYWTLIPTS